MEDLPVVAEAVAVAIRLQGQEAVADLVQVGEAVPVKIGPPVVGIVAAAGLAAQAIAVGVAQRGEALSQARA